MRASEILRKLADVIDSAEAGQEAPQVQQPQHANVRVALAPAQQPAAEQPQGAETTFVPPLQAKLEILKKSEGIPNVYDGADQEGDELDTIKKHAGLTTAQKIASEDNDITG